MPNNPYTDIHASLLNFCTKTREGNEDLTDWLTYDFDAHATTSDIPEQDLVGIAEYSLIDEDKTYGATCMLIICTKADDAGLKRLRGAVNIFKDLLRPTAMITTVKDSDGSIVGNLILKPPVHIMPIANTSGRPLVALALQLGSSYLTPP